MTVPPSYKIEFSATARRGMNKLPVEAALALLELISGPLAENPRRLGKPLDEPYDGVLSARRGEYRVLYAIQDNTMTVVVLAVSHRRDAYRPR
ncbi:type II toxin-antitoxin system mRNA interferase RelE [Allokutzneria multivorans]|uniref:Type II toxin-antitoxin system mRNA interferase RelE n=1 Tax=Allokutzneria multivorans TaxID=1142134 RepID=A0ABP7RBX9_9PSEU